MKRRKPAAKAKKGVPGKKTLVFATVVLLAAGAVASWWYGVEAPRRAAVGLAKVEARQKSEREARRAQADEAALKERVAELYGSVASAGSDELRKKTIYEQVLELERGSGQALRELGRIDALRGSVEVVTEPEGAGLRLVGAAGEGQGKEVGKGKSPVKLDGLALGGYSLQVDAAGFETDKREVSLLNGDTQKMKVVLKRSVGSLAIHSTPPGMRYELKRVSSEAADYDGAFAAREGVTPKVLEDLPTGKYEVVMRREGWPEYRKDYAVGREVETAVDWEFAEGKVRIESEPPGAEVREDGKLLGVTPLDLVLPVGQHGMSLSLAKHCDLEAKFSVKTGSGVERLVLEKRPYPVAGETYVNSLGVKMVPAGTDGVLFSVYETRVKDFREFVEATGYDAVGGAYSLASNEYKQAGASWKDPHFPIGEDHCVTCVSWQDAQAFCKWLTERESKAGLLGPGQEYRLPSDLEWSAAVGLGSEGGSIPEARNLKVTGKYPWGDYWPPKRGDEGNYCGKESYWGAAKSWSSWTTVEEGYTDDHPRTAPVGSYPANEYGLYDMGGNVWEWCGDWLNSGRKERVMRGGSWVDGTETYLRSSFRFKYTPSFRFDNFGFRLVLGVGVGS